MHPLDTSILSHLKFQMDTCWFQMLPLLQLAVLAPMLMTLLRSSWRLKVKTFYPLIS